MFELPLDLTRRWIDCLQKSAIRLSLVGGEVCAPVIGMAGFIRLWSRAESVALIASGYVEQTRLRVVSWCHEVCGAERAGANSVALERRRSLFLGYGTAFGVFCVAPRGLAVCVGRDQLAGSAIEDVKKSVAIGLRDEMLAASFDHDWNLRGVPVVLVVLGELKIPVELAGVGIERQQRIAVEISSGAPLPSI